MSRTVVYVDGFNLYYGSLRGTPLRWLNIDRLCRVMLPAHDVQRINYYTAMVTSRRSDPGQSVRQQMYLRALATLPHIEIHLGHFLSHSVWMPLARPQPDGPKFACVIRTDEKGSDVNLATHLVRDGYENRFDAAVVISNDSDLLAPIQLVKERLHKRVGVLNPQRHPSVVLSKHATFYKQLRASALRASQFPDELTDGIGAFRVPEKWVGARN